MRDYISQYQSDVTSLNRKYGVKESDEYYTRLDRLYSDWLKKMKGFSFESMSQDGKVDYVLLRNSIEKDAFDLQQNKNEFSQVQATVPFAGKIMAMVQKRRTGAPFDGKETAKVFNDLKKELQATQKEIEKQPKYSDKLSKKAVAAATDYRKAFNELFAFYNEYDPQFTWWTNVPHTEADTAFSQYIRFLKTWKAAGKDDGSGIIGNPIGKEEIIRSLQAEFISYSPEDLIDIANKEFAWCEKEMLKASQEMGFGTDWKKALEKVKTDHVEPGKQPELVYFLANEATEFLEKNNLVTVPELAKEDWRMKMLSAQQQRFSPFFLGGDDILIAFPTTTMTYEDRMMSMRGNNRHFARATVFHELIPGHHLQGFMIDRYNAHRSAFYTPFWMEGWALYWEMILWEKNFQKSPENRVGMLFWRMHRCARIIFSLNYHMNIWTPQQCIDFLVDKVGHERANAGAEVRRSFTGGYGPLYQLAYMIGAKEFYALRQELVTSGKMKERDFHDAILQNGPISVELVRALLTNQNLTRDYKTNWKFGY
ncbi:X-Pro dipeptidyl-peptidase [Cytophagales bacterium WSM2-2]|nr:X-Pro dipeptidyl-peptidase [Cytophagales bacterium WSM2-2]